MQEGSDAPVRGFPGDVTHEEHLRALQRRLVVLLNLVPAPVVVTQLADELYPEFSLATPDVNTPGASSEIRPGVFATTGDFWIALSHLTFRWTKAGGGNPDWRVIVKIGEDLGLPGETINGEIAATVLGAGGVDEFEAFINAQLDLGEETIPPQEFALFLGIDPGAADQTVSGLEGDGWLACNGVPPT